MIIYREMTEADVKKAAKLEASAFSTPWSEHAFLEAVQNEHAYFMIAEENNRILAQCGYYDLCKEADISNVVVSEEMRGRGIGKEMLKKLIAHGKEQGIEAFTLEVRIGNVPAVALYKSLGFQEAGVRPGFYTKPKEDALIMWLREDA